MPTRVAVVGDNACSNITCLRDRFASCEFLAVTGPEELERAIKEFQPECAFSIKSPIFPGTIHRKLGECESLKWLQVGGSGFDHLLPWDRSDVTITNCAGVLSQHLAETVIGMILSLNLDLPRYYRQQLQKRWEPHPFVPLSQQTLLVVGLGNIGGWVAHHAKSLGMRVIGVRRTASPHPWADQVVSDSELSAVIEEADFVSVHVRLSDETRGMFDAGMLSKMKPGAFFLNTSRGAVVDEAALVAALRSGHLRAAYLDVFEQEPLPLQSPLWSMENVLVTPHSADDIIGWEEVFTQFFAENLQKHLCGEELANIVKI